MTGANGDDAERDSKSARPPEVPTDRLDSDGWELAEEDVSTVFRIPTAEIRDHRVVYEDAALRRGVREATDGALDQPWRFFFASRLTFLPPLAPGVGPASVRPSVETESRRAFADELRDRGFENVERGRRQRMPTEHGGRASLTKYTAELPVEIEGAARNVDVEDMDRSVDVEGWLAVWTRRETFRVAGGAYPVDGLQSLAEETGGTEGVVGTPGDFRDELIELVQRVG